MFSIVGFFSPTCSGYSSLKTCYFFICFSFCWTQSNKTLILFFLADPPPLFLPISPVIVCIISTILIIKYRPFSKDNTFLKKFFNCFKFFFLISFKFPAHVWTVSPCIYLSYHSIFKPKQNRMSKTTEFLILFHLMLFMGESEILHHLVCYLFLKTQRNPSNPTCST